ncbi:MAG: hypothetical protein K0S65_1052, partial [Labilithrix sp.]|nr:hypothetical protein [Labilithrix sp.]
MASSTDAPLLGRELLIDKTIDFILVFVGLYAAIAAQRHQEEQKQREEYV